MNTTAESRAAAFSLIIGTRASKLALAQTEMIRAALERAHPGLQVGVEHITTKGDVILDRPLSAIGDKGLFVTEIEDAMREGRIDLAVHSAKDLPSELPPDMTLAAFAGREDPRDALVSQGFRVTSWTDCTEAGADWFEARQRAQAAAAKLPALGLHVVMGSEFGIAGRNLGRNLREGRAGLIQAIAQKP